MKFDSYNGFNMKNNNDLIIVGAGGHAKVILSVALCHSEHMIGYLDDNPDLINQIVCGYPVVGNLSILENFNGSVVLGLGNNVTRQAIAQRYAASNWQTFVHPHAFVHPSVKLGKGTVVFAGAVIQPDVVIGDHCIINTGATVDHDCVIGDYVHLAPGVHLAGNVRMGEGVFMGIGSVVIPGIEIGKWTEVAAGSVVVKSILARKKVMGVPAKERV